jgi:hypothetical protein
MRIWLSCFLVLFGLAELFQWMKQLSLPLPVFILGGAFLAIASNYDRRAGFPFNQLPANFLHPLEPQNSDPMAESEPPIAVNQRPQRPISFVIRKPEN